MDRAYLQDLATGLCSGTDKLDRLDPPMKAWRLREIEDRFGFEFPADLKALLEFTLPLGRLWPNWRDGTDEELQARLAWPREGILLDVRNGFWLDAWGARPGDEPGRVEVVNGMLDSAPRLVPIFSHRYIPSTPGQSGSPVFSVSQSDVIYASSGKSVGH